MKLQIKILNEQARIPKYHSARAAGMDLCACLEVPFILEPMQTAAIPTGIAIAIEGGYEGQIRARSGIALKHSIIVTNAPGTIDSDYRGEVKVILTNLGPIPYTIQPEERIAQLVIAPVIKAKVRIVKELPQTKRGKGGFGSSGKT